MANPEHLKLLLEGVLKWNRWRENNPKVIPDFCDAYLSYENLGGANLIQASLGGANLIGTDLSSADLSGVSLYRANLREANLCQAKLYDAYLYEATLRGANLEQAILHKANFYKADLTYANLSNVVLDTAQLIDAKLDGATLTGSSLWETQRAGWSIKGVICEYVFWDMSIDPVGKDTGIVLVPADNSPRKKSFYRPGEFERLFTDKMMIRLFYKDGISPLEIATIPALIKHLEYSHPTSGLRLVSIREDSDGVVAELAIEGADNKTPEQLRQLKSTLEAEAQQRVQYQRQALLEREARLQLEGEVKQLSSVIDKLILRQSIIVNQGGVTMGNETYQNYGQIGAQGHNAHAHDLTFNQVMNRFERSIDLPTLAKQLAELREEMAKDSSPQSAIAQGETAKAQIAVQSGDISKVMAHLKSAGKWTLDFAKEVGKDVVVEAIKQSMGMP